MEILLPSNLGDSQVLRSTVHSFPASPHTGQRLVLKPSIIYFIIIVVQLLLTLSPRSLPHLHTCTLHTRPRPLGIVTFRSAAAR